MTGERTSQQCTRPQRPLQVAEVIAARCESLRPTGPDRASDRIGRDAVTLETTHDDAGGQRGDHEHRHREQAKNDQESGRAATCGALAARAISTSRRVCERQAGVDQSGIARGVEVCGFDRDAMTLLELSEPFDQPVERCRFETQPKTRFTVRALVA